MNRRNFIKVMSAGTGTLLVPSLLNGCTQKELMALEGWRGPSPQEKDVRMLVLSYAILAPNPHNKQPWLIDLKRADRFDLYVDPERLLPETDPPYRQIHIGQGTFLENLELAANQLGYRVQIDYFPKGMYGNTVLEKKPVASIQLIPDSTIAKNPLFDQILKRHSNKRIYEDRPLSASQLKTIQQVVPKSTEGVQLTLTSDGTLKNQLVPILEKAMKIETSNRDRDMETIAMFRFNDDEVETYRDGFGVVQSGMEGMTKWFAETFFLSRDSVTEDPKSFGEQAVSMTKEQAASAVAYGWLTTSANTRLDQVTVGRLYERINLTTTRMGLAMHPMSQVLQEYEDMMGLQKDFKQLLKIPESHTVQMLFRLGYAEPTIHSARRRVKDLMMG